MVAAQKASQGIPTAPIHIQASIVIVTYNNRAHIDACLQSVQASSADVEIIVVDNLSTDGTLTHVRRHYPDVVAVSAGRNGGFGAGVNAGARLARGAFLTVLNPDTEVEAGWLDPLMDILERRPHVGLATPTILLRGSDERVNACGNTVHLTGLAFCAGLNAAAPGPEAAVRSVAAVSGAAFVVRRTLWERLGGFDERFFMYLEDTDLSLRVRRLGYTIVHVPASRVWHDYRVSVSATKLYHLERNRLLMLRKNLSPTTLAILAPALLLTEALTWAFCVRSGPAYLRAKRHSYHGLWRDRRAVEPGERCAIPPSHDSDGVLLRGFVGRLAIEQLEDGSATRAINGIAAAFYTLWRSIALALIRR